MLTAQEYYDLLVKSSMDGTFPSYRMKTGNMTGEKLPTCSYRGENGSRCAIGVIVPDDLYPFLQEGFGIFEDNLEVIKPLLPEGISVENARRIQTTHDCLIYTYDALGNCELIPWSPRKFVERINEEGCFPHSLGVKKVEPSLLPDAVS